MTAVLFLCVVILCVSVPVVSAQDVRTGVEQLASQIIKTTPAGKQLRIAVVDFPDLQGVTSDLGRFIAGRLTTRLVQEAKFSVIERQRLAQVLAELKFSMSDLVDPAKAKQLGRMVGVEAIVVGTISDLGNQVDIDARMIEIESNRMLLGASATISKDQVVDDLLKRGRLGPSPGAPVPAPSPETPTPTELPKGLKFVHKYFTFEVSGVEIVDEQIKLTLAYMNRQEAPAEGGIYDYDLNRTYVVDNVGNRYKYTGDSFNRRRVFPPQIPEQIWVTFEKLRSGATVGNLVLHWGYWVGTRHVEDVVIRNIPLRR